MYTPAYISAYILLFIFSLLIFGGLYSICRHYFHKYEMNAPVRKDKRKYKKYVKEFDKQNPITPAKDPIIQIKNEIDRLQKLEKFIE